MAFMLKIGVPGPHAHLSPSEGRASTEPGRKPPWDSCLPPLPHPQSLSGWLLPSSQPSQPWETYGKGTLITDTLGS